MEEKEAVDEPLARYADVEDSDFPSRLEATEVEDDDEECDTVVGDDEGCAAVGDIVVLPEAWDAKVKDEEELGRCEADEELLCELPEELWVEESSDGVTGDVVGMGVLTETDVVGGVDCVVRTVSL